MSYANDSIFQTIQQIRTPGILEELISSAWNQWSKWVSVINIKQTLIHYRPFRGGRIMLKACAIQKDTGEFLREIDFFLQIYPDNAPAKDRVEKERSNHHVPPPLFIPELQAVLWTLPNIPRLRKLKKLMRYDNFRSLLLPEAEKKPGVYCELPPKLFRLVPRKRAILTWEHSQTHSLYFVKLFNKADAQRVSNNYLHIEEISKQGKLDFNVPEIISYNPSCRTLLMTKIPGKTFTEEMRKTIPGSFGKVGRVLGQLHKSQAKPEIIQSQENEIEALTTHMGEVKLVLPNVGIQLEAVSTILANAYQNLPLPKTLPIHGNLFGDQILYGQDTIGIVDWDAFCYGDPVSDVGRLIAHLLFLAGTEDLNPIAVKTCVETLLHTYQEEIREPVNKEWLSWHVTAQLLMRGKITSLRKIPEDWVEQLAFVAKEAEQLVNGSSYYLNLPALNTKKKKDKQEITK